MNQLNLSRLVHFFSKPNDRKTIRKNPKNMTGKIYYIKKAGGCIVSDNKN